MLVLRFKNRYSKIVIQKSLFKNRVAGIFQKFLSTHFKKCFFTSSISNCLFYTSRIVLQKTFFKNHVAGFFQKFWHRAHQKSIFYKLNFDFRFLIRFFIRFSIWFLIRFSIRFLIRFSIWFSIWFWFDFRFDFQKYVKYRFFYKLDFLKCLKQAFFKNPTCKKIDILRTFEKSSYAHAPKNWFFDKFIFKNGASKNDSKSCFKNFR